MSDPHASPWTPTPSTTAPMLGQPAEAPTVGAEPDECPATGNGCHFGPHGPNGEKQCQYCGSPAPNPEPKADGLLLDLAIANGCELTGTPDGGEAVKLAVHADRPKLHEYEICAVLGDPACLAALMRNEDLRYTEHSAVYGADAHVTWPTARYTELKERGRAIVAQDPEIWPDDILNAFGIPIPPKPPTESPYVQGLRFAVQQAERVAIDLDARRETSDEEAKSAALRSLKYAAPSKYAFRDTAMTCDGAASAYEVAANRARDAVKALKRALDLHSSY